MKKLLSVFFVMMLAAGVAFADNTIEVLQDGTTAYADISQDGNGNDANVNQKATDEGNSAIVTQATGSGYAYIADVDQTAKTYNEVVVNQNTPGGPGTVIINQTAATQYNKAEVDYNSGWFYDTNVDIKQAAGQYNDADVKMWGAVSYGRVSVDQDSPNGFNTIDVQSQNGTRVVQANSDGTISTASYPALPAIQSSTSGNNELWVSAMNGELGLYQTGAGDNSADVTQNKSSLGVYQVASSDGNTLRANQGGNDDVARIVQNAGSYNFADIASSFGNNSLNVNQTATTGYNSLTSTQGGGATAIINQTGTIGNTTTVNQF